MLANFKRALVLAPHTDDGEFGAGGTINRLVRAGVTIRYIGFSGCEESVPKGYPADILRREVLEATSCLGIPNNNVSVLNYRVRRFNESRQDILEDMVRTRRDYAPDLVLLPSLNDIHQDHNVIAQEGCRAFKTATMLCYELPWNNFGVKSNAYIRLDEVALKAKLDAIRAYKSQAQRPYSQAETLTAWARTRGLEGGIDFAEAMEVLRWSIA